MFKHINQISEQALFIDFDDEIDIKINHKVNLFAKKILNNIKKINELKIINCVPSYNKILIQFDPEKQNKAKIINYINSIKLDKNYIISRQKIIEIPICYDDMYALDLNEISNNINLTKKEIIKIHLSTIFHVYMIGFIPGLPFLGNMNSNLSLPRKPSPRISVPKGSVGIVNNLCVIYPQSSPGGWNIIGRTPINLFFKKRKNPSILKMNDKVKFKEISKKEFNDY